MTQILGSKADITNQNYNNVDTFQLDAIPANEINDRAPNDANGTMYHDGTADQLVVKLDGALELIVLV